MWVQKLEIQLVIKVGGWNDDGGLCLSIKNLRDQMGL